MLGRGLRLGVVMLMLGALAWTQQLVASNRDEVCHASYTICIDTGCCLGLPGECQKMCYYDQGTDSCECRDRLPGGGGE